MANRRAAGRPFGGSDRSDDDRAGDDAEQPAQPGDHADLGQCRHEYLSSGRAALGKAPALAPDAAAQAGCSHEREAEQRDRDAAADQRHPLAVRVAPRLRVEERKIGAGEGEGRVGGVENRLRP